MPGCFYKVWKRCPCGCSATAKTAWRLPAGWSPIAAWDWVRYPGLKSSPTYHLKEKYLPKGQGALVGFGIKGGKEAAVKFIESCRLFSHLANIGDAKSLVIHPASTTHEQLGEAEQRAAGVTPDFIRLSVGIEDLDDIIADLDNALEKGVACTL